MSVVPRLRDPALDIRKKFLNLEFYKYWNGFTAPGLLWGEWNTCLRMQNLRIPITSVIEVSTIFKYRNKCKISTMNNTSKFYIKTGSNRSGIWVEEVKILFTSTADFEHHIPLHFVPLSPHHNSGLHWFWHYSTLLAPSASQNVFNGIYWSGILNIFSF